MFFDSEEIQQKLHSALSDASILILVPPFTRSCKGVAPEPHTLSAIAADAGFKADILYLNVLFASLIGTEVFEEIGNSPRINMFGEKLFSGAAYGQNQPENDFPFSQMKPLAEKLASLSASVIAEKGYRFIWSSMNWQQINATIAVFNRIKELNSSIMTVGAGLQCDQEMTKGILSLTNSFDYLVSGEPERTFKDMLSMPEKSERRLPSLIQSKKTVNLDELPEINYRCYFEQLELFLGKDHGFPVLVGYETSRGCRKAEGQPCSFCSLNTQDRIHYRYKSASKVKHEIDSLVKHYPEAKIFMMDNDFPSAYFQELLPILSIPESASIRYYTKANLSLNQLHQMKKAGITSLQPGIESLSPTWLKRVKKRVFARSNVMMLRNARSLGVSLYWYLLHGIPGDETGDYEAMIDLIPLLHHLQPPDSVAPVRLERFSEFILQPEQFHLNNPKPVQAYRETFPSGTDFLNLAYFYQAEYPCGSIENPDIIETLRLKVHDWKQHWKESKLVLLPFNGEWLIYDQRKITGNSATHLLSQNQALEVMTYGKFKETEKQSWSLENKLGVQMEGYYVPLITASESVLKQLGLLRKH